MKFREAGAGDPVIFLHGFPFNKSMWQPQLDAVPEGWRFIAPDLRGFGESEDAGVDPLAMSTLADDVIALMDEQNIEQAVVVGLSMGGYVAFDLVVRYPARVRALVLTATRANADSEEAKANRYSLATKVRSAGTLPVIETMLPHLLSAHSKLQMPELAKSVRAMMESTSPRTMTRGLEGMAERPDFTNRLGEINTATLIIRGDQDDIINPSDMEAIARGVRGARHEVITLAGHLPNLENPEVFNNILTGFLNFLPPSIKLDFNFSL